MYKLFFIGNVLYDNIDYFLIFISSNGQAMEQMGSRDMLTSVITSTGNQNVRDD